MNHRPTPEALHHRPAHAGRWTVTPTPVATTRDVLVDPATSTMQAPTASSDEAREARRLALLRAALDPTDFAKFTETVASASASCLNDTTLQRITTAANTWRIHHYATTTDTANVGQLHDPYAVAMVHAIGSQMTTDRRALVETAALWAETRLTADAKKVTAAIRKHHPDLATNLSKAQRQITAKFAAIRNNHSYYNDHERRYGCGASFHALMVTTDILHALSAAIGDDQPPISLGDTADSGTPGGDTTPDNPSNELWHKPRLWRGALTCPSLGMLARSSRRRVDHGRIIHNPSKLYTDPMRRAFYRKTRGNGATIVLDISGSMSLDTDDVRELLQAAPGATIIAYRTTGAENLWLLAHDGLSVDLDQPLPVEPGGSNGLDGPALAYAAKLHTPGEPFIWITDGKYNGNGRGCPDASLAHDILRTLDTIPNATWYYYIPDAVDTLERISRGGHDEPPSIPNSVRRFRTK